MLFPAFLFVIFALNMNLGDSHTCQTFKGVEALLYDKNGTKFKKAIDGCIERIEFDNNTNVVEAYVNKQLVKTLWKDTVRNMKYLETVSFVKCETEIISPIAFRNVPNLLNIEISRCKLKEIGRDIFTFELTPKLQNLALDNNEIEYIEDESFSNLTSLRKINLSNNQLEFWKQEWFRNATILEIMDFRHNQIRALPRKAFMELRTLRHICLDYNNIARIHRDAFKEIRYLEYLGLSHNKLTVLESNSFPNLLKIDTFAIHANYLNYLTNGLLQKIVAVKVTMDYNPWKCECLERINHWLFIKNGQYFIPDNCKGYHIPICAVSQRSSRSCSDSVDPELTQRYINMLRNISTPFDPDCAQLA